MGRIKWHPNRVVPKLEGIGGRLRSDITRRKKGRQPPAIPQQNYNWPPDAIEQVGERRQIDPSDPFEWNPAVARPEKYLEHRPQSIVPIFYPRKAAEIAGARQGP
nr:hypothetical protein [Cupriavidus pinatubonensis]